MNNFKLQNLLIILGIVFAMFYGITKMNWLITFGIPALLFIAMLIGKPGGIVLLTFAISGAQLKIGSYTGPLYLHEFLAIGLAPVLVVAHIFRSRESITPAEYPILFKFLIWFVILTLILAIYRGIGINKLGSSTVGGIGYIQIWGISLFALASTRCKLRSKQTRYAIAAYFILSALPFSIRYINEFLGGQLNFLSFFMSAVAIKESSIEGVLRLGGVQNGGIAFITLAIALFRPQRPNWMMTGLLSGFGVFILANSGYRSALLISLGTVFFYFYLRRRYMNQTLLVSIFFGIVIIAAFLFGFASYLPFSAQRMLAWVPGLQLDPVARFSAEGTTEWRLELWMETWDSYIPKHLVVGRGLSFDAWAVYYADLIRDQGDYGGLIESHNYHSGPLFLLVDFGLPGFFLCVGFMVSSILRHMKAQHGDWPDPIMQNFHAALTSSLMARMISYFIVFGSLSSILRMILDVTLLEALARFRFPEDAKLPSAVSLDQ